MKVEMTFDMPGESEAFEAMYNGPSYLLAMRQIKKEIFQDGEVESDLNFRDRVRSRFVEILNEYGVLDL